jgi:uncharacterized DUF497 family protein
MYIQYLQWTSPTRFAARPLNGMPRRRRRILRKHRISFEKACEVFFDPFLRLLDASANDERRDAVLGLTEDWSLLFVVHVVHQGDILRIISARPATSSERRTYEHE